MMPGIQGRLMNDGCLATADFTLKWRRNGVRFEEVFHAPRVNLWRDLLPGPICRGFDGAGEGDRIEAEFKAGDLLPVRDERCIYRVLRRETEPGFAGGLRFSPRLGRFYPCGVLRGIPGIFRENISPFRCIGLDGEGLVADLNHPLAGIDLAFSARILEIRDKFEEHGGTCIDWFETIAGGPGMQAPCAAGPTDFFDRSGFERDDASPDPRFYHRPRMVQHIDDTAVGVIRALYGKLLPPGGRVLDLMSSWTSHLPDDLPLDRLSGLGMNRDELAANPRLTDVWVHDLNADPRLPYADGEMDAVVCSLSVEYLTRPFDVFAEVRRVLKRGGLFAVTFSDRWFPPKAIRLWAELHPFERMGFVLELFSGSGGFQRLETFSARGYPRPAHDKYARQRADSDPVFAVWGRTA